MAQIYDNTCDECGQDRDAERRLRALWTAYRQQGENYVEVIAHADHAEYTLSTLRRDYESWRSKSDRMQALYQNLHALACVAVQETADPDTAMSLLERFLENNPPSA